jgi:hypothetical protein
MSFGGKPSGEGFAKHYELHCQPKMVEADGGEKYQQFDCINFHGRRGEADSSDKEQMASWVDEGLVLLQGA